MAKLPPSQFADVKLANPVAVFQLTAQCKADSCEKKINLGVGAYRTDEGQPWVLPVVKSVEAHMAKDPLLNHEYLPILGAQDFCDAATKICLGEDSSAIVENRVSGIQSLGGTGALRIAAEFLKRFYNQRETCMPVFVSDPTWANHYGIFRNAGFNDIRRYRYWDTNTRTINFAGFTEDLQTAPEYSIVVFHACAHNPTGIDPTQEQWKTLAKICMDRNLFPIFDCAYQGFASGDLDVDAWSIRYFVQAGFEMLVCQSFSKNFGLYNERIGNLILVMRDSKFLAPSRSQIELIIRTMFSNPPSHGQRVVATTLKNKALKQEWIENVQTMANRIKDMRQMLHSKLRAAGTPGNWDHIINQIGMFSYTGLTESQVEYLIKEKHIYLPSSGRISMCGLNESNVDYFVQAVHEAITVSQNGKL
uniref:Aspartate aminotransferase n=1 Tax=Phallusia mammillata TaxID=59560 RepID=A0A6F9DEE7_9ASCI|nr:aspartate aminotransferase, cytoplasmic-like [Phallusia mammillata]